MISAMGLRIDRLRRELRDRMVQAAGHQAEAAIKRQLLRAEELRRRGVHVGRGSKNMKHKLNVDPVMLGQWRKKYGEHCMMDPKFVEEAWRDNPMLRVPE